MHELAVCQGLIREVERVVAENHAARATSLTLQIGPLSGVEEILLRDAFPIASAGTIAEGAELNIQSMPILVCCLTCGEQSTATLNKLVCGCCGDFRTQVISGEELLLRSVELEREEIADPEPEPILN